MEGVDLLRSFQRQSEAIAVSILPLQALGVDAQEVPHSARVARLGRLMDVLAWGITVTELAQLSIPGIPCMDTPSRPESLK